MNEFQRKIELQSSDDLQFLVSNIRRAARGKIDQDLPPLRGEDAIRTQVERIVSQYIEDVVKNISANITINGLEPTEVIIDTILKLKLDETKTKRAGTVLEIEEYESFNTRLFQQAQKLAQEEEDLIEEIARLRRTVPAKIVESVKTEFKEGIEANEAALKTLKEHVELSSVVKSSVLNITALEREEAIEKDWDKSIQGLANLMRSIPEMVAKKVRTEEVEKYLTQDEQL
ncbi:putative kinetochore protein [Erysiphe neolycopersici]|uniref:Putative kinetochore protein n=1 Tax=Erysiphe neolycopersici TaxID=212602 RepID=A0A420HRK1_9PEZI|nr:putative kinetochore protein [Erysiphe neolycopersici]